MTSLAAPGTRTPPRSRAARLTAPAGVAAGAVGVLGYISAVDPNQPGHYPTCPFLWVTGLFCPGCGSLRTLHALTHLDVAAAVSLNVLVTAFVPLLVLWWARWSYRQWTGRPRRWLAPGWVLWGLLAVIVGFWVLRNVPAFAVLAP